MEQKRLLTIILFGRTGAGKSSLGNQILGKDVFLVGETLNSQTDSVSSEVFEWSLDPSINVKVIDTPGFGGNKQEIANEVLLSRTLDFLKKTNDGFHIAVYCMPAKTRIDHHDTQELEMLRLLLGDDFFKHVCLAITQANTLLPDHRQKVCQSFVNDLPGIFLENGLPPFTQDRIIFADFDNLEKSFLEPLKNFIRTTTSYVPEISGDINPEDPESILRFLAMPEMKKIKDAYETEMAAQKKKMEGIQQTIVQQDKEKQQKISEHNQRQKALQDDLARIRSELTSTQNQYQSEKQRLENSNRQKETEKANLGNQINSLTLQNNEKQRQLNEKDSIINDLHTRISQM